MVRRRARSVGALALAASIVGVVACDQVFGIDERTALDGGGGDATSDQATGTGDGAPADAPGETGADSAPGGDAKTDAPFADGPTTDGPPSDGPLSDGPVSDGPAPEGSICSTLYVDGAGGDAGSDSNSGCSSAAPKSTIASAITYAQGNAAVKQIWVCAGTYSGAIALDTSVSLLGGFNCGTWQRQAATYGYPSFSSDVTTLTSNAAVTLTIGSISTTVDGFTITNTGTGSLGATSIGLRIGGPGTSTISNDHIVGGATVYTGADDAPASAGLLLTQGAAPTFTADLVEGGSGTTNTNAGTGSVGVFADGTNGTVSISGSTIRGGTGAANGLGSGTGSQGLIFTGSTTTTPIAYTVTGSTVVGGSGKTITCSGSCRATRGLYVPSGVVTLTLTDDAIDGGDEVNDAAGATTGTLCPHGVEVTAQGSVTATGNRIFGGICNIGSAAMNQASLYGMFVGSGAALTAENNMIHMGISYIPHGAAALGVAGSPAPQIRHNTLIAGTNTGTSLGALWLQGSTSGAVVENNILASSGPGTAGTASGLLLSCPPDAGTVTIASFQNNLVFATPDGLMQWENCNGTASYTTVDAMTTELTTTQPGATVAGNLTLAATTTLCGSDSGCVAWTGCTSAAACLDAVFLGFADSSYGEANLFPGAIFAGTCPAATEPGSGNGWPIRATPPCKVAQSTRMDTGTVAKDLYGNCRGTSPTIGAAEYTGSCL